MMVRKPRRGTPLAHHSPRVLSDDQLPSGPARLDPGPCGWLLSREWLALATRARVTPWCALLSFWATIRVAADMQPHPAVGTR